MPRPRDHSPARVPASLPITNNLLRRCVGRAGRLLRRTIAPRRGACVGASSRPALVAAVLAVVVVSAPAARAGVSGQARPLPSTTAVATTLPGPLSESIVTVPAESAPTVPVFEVSPSGVLTPATSPTTSAASAAKPSTVRRKPKARAKKSAVPTTVAPVPAGDAKAVVAPGVSDAAAGSDVWAALRKCESGGRYDVNSGNGYYGAYQFAVGTWRKLGYPGYPHEAAPAVQDEAARKLQAVLGWGQWPACSRKLGLR